MVPVSLLSIILAIFLEKHGYMWRLEEYDPDLFPYGFMYLTPPSTNQGKWAERMTVNCPMPFSAVSQWVDSYTGNRPQAYKQWKEATMQQVLDKLERVCPHLRDDVDFCLASTPLTIETIMGLRMGRCMAIITIAVISCFRSCLLQRRSVICCLPGRILTCMVFVE